MVKVFIWGAGTYAETVYESIEKSKCRVLNVIDSNSSRHQTEWKFGIKIAAPQTILSADYDYIIVSPQNSEPIIRQCILMGIDSKRIIDFWNEDHNYEFINYSTKTISILNDKVKKYKLRWENAPYELGVKPVPHVKTASELAEVLIKENASLCRFGDGELEIMCGRERLWYQHADKELALRLKEVFQSQDKSIIVAIADDFGNLDCFTEEAADAIRKYMQKDIRDDLMRFIDMNRTYYDAYISRPYILYKDKEGAKQKFDLLKKLWDGRRTLIVEGNSSRMGVGNDLFSNVKSLKRILCPSTESFAKYGEILEAIKEQVIKTGADLVLLSLGPTATVLAYDLAKSGIVALDIGQVDNEYEWYLRKTDKRMRIPGKMTAEYDWVAEIEDEQDELYTSQIVQVIK